MSAKLKLNEVVILSGARTPIGSFKGELAGVTATQLGAIATKAAVEKAGISPDAVQELYFGNVISAGLAQAPARQVAVFAGLPHSTICTLVHKVCSSGIKSVMLAAQTLQVGAQEIIVAGGMESLSNVPYYLKRGETPYGGITMADGIIFDGLTDVYEQIHIGNCAEAVAKKLNITREEQDAQAVLMYQRAAEGYKTGAFDEELVPVPVPQKNGPPIIVKEDVEHKKLNLDKFYDLPPVFQKENGTVTAGNACPLTDGAAAVVLSTMDAAKKYNLKPLARIIGMADIELAPIDFPMAPSRLIPKLLEKTNKKVEDIALWEINEPFSVVVVACLKHCGIDVAKVNIHGSAVCLGHPLGASGSRIITHLTYTLKKGDIGVAVICNGGGGASSVMIEKLN